MRSLGLTADMVEAIERYRAVLNNETVKETRYAALRLADLVLQAYDSWVVEYARLTHYQRRLLATAWREHRRAEVIESRGGAPAGIPHVSNGREQTMAALRALHMLDEQGHLTAGGRIAALRAWEEVGAPDIAD